MVIKGSNLLDRKLLCTNMNATNWPGIGLRIAGKREGGGGCVPGGMNG